MPKITELTALTGTLNSSDVFPVVNGSATKKITLSSLRENIFTGGSVSTGALANLCVSNSKLADDAVTNVKVQSGSLSQDRLATVAGLTAQVYGSATSIPVLTLTTQGTISAASTQALRSMASASVFQPLNGTRFDLFRTTYAITPRTAITANFYVGSGTATLAASSPGGPINSFPIGTSIPAGSLVFVTFSLLSSTAQNWTMSFGFTYD